MFVFVFVFVLWLKKCEVRMKVDARSRLLGSVWRKEGRKEWVVWVVWGKDAPEETLRLLRCSSMCG